MIRVVRSIVFGVPIGGWLIHVLIIIPAIASRSGCSAYGLEIDFFCLSSLSMLACLGPSVVLAARSKRPADLLAILLNLSWLYYLKVLYGDRRSGIFDGWQEVSQVGDSSWSFN